MKIGVILFSTLAYWLSTACLVLSIHILLTCTGALFSVSTTRKRQIRVLSIKVHA